jgi:protein-tyrosine-phosphatase
VRTPTRPPALFKLLADEVRWRLVTALARSDRRGQELGTLLRRPPNLISYHLRQLMRHKLVAERRSTADRRDVYFSLRLDALQRLYAAGGQALHPALAGAGRARPAAGRLVRVLFLCTHNSARSQMAEALLRHASQGAVEVHSAGTEPARLHPLAVEVMAERGLRLDGQRSKHVSGYAGQTFDYVITVCDLAREACPAFPGEPEQIHWSLPDPAAVVGARVRRAFETTADELEARVEQLRMLIEHDMERKT